MFKGINVFGADCLIKPLFCLIFIIISVSLRAQPPQVIPPSPNGAAFQKYGNIPVSTYTGIPNISIPVLTVSSGDITVPIALSYHASGVKVAEEASKAGLGWVINAGGLITRNIVAGDDFVFDTQYYPYHNNVVSELPSSISGNVLQNVQDDCQVKVCMRNLQQSL